MTHKTQRTLLKVLAFCLGIILVCVIGIAVVLSMRDKLSTPTVPQQSTQGTTVPPDTTTPTTEPTTVPTTEPTTAPTTEPTTVPTTEPEPEVFTLSFAGDCTLGNHRTASGSHTFIGTVGDNYAYPFADVLPYFSQDDCTFVNLECALTDGGVANELKLFTFKGPAAYTAILTEGSVEFANVVNNHAKDYGKSGYRDTLAGLDSVGIYYAEEEDTRVFTTESGLTIGVFASYFPTSTWGVQKKIDAMRAEGAEIVVVAVHWGEEYDYHPNSNEKKFAHQFIDAGADIVWGHHPHVLQDMEYYNGGVIMYSMGNFSFGGNSSPSDKDTAIVQLQIIRQPDGTVELGETTIIPCYVSGILSWGNDYQPTPMEVGSEAYNRVLKKLDGTFEKEGLKVSYRDDLNDETEPTTQPTEPATQPTEPVTQPTESATEPSVSATEPSEQPSEPSAPAEGPSEPAPSDPPAA